MKVGHAIALNGALQLAFALRVSPGHSDPPEADAARPYTFRPVATSELVPFCLVMNRAQNKARRLVEKNSKLGRDAQTGSMTTEGSESGMQAFQSDAEACDGDETSSCVRTLGLQDNTRAGSLESKSAEECASECSRNPICMGSQFMPQGQGLWPCTFRIKTNIESSGDTCLSNCRALFQSRGFKDVPLVPVDDSDGGVYMREDCMDESVTLHNNTYHGIPWDWEQPGVSLVRQGGYGVSPLLDLATPQVLGNLIPAMAPPWAGPKGARAGVDVVCSRADSDNPMAWWSLMNRLKDIYSGGHDRALVVDIGKCICPMLSNGWNPTLDLKIDVVFLLYRDENFSPASPHTEAGYYADRASRVQCVQYHGSTSIFASDVEAFTALADNPHVFGMYFTQTPPIAHDKVFLVPLGVDMHEYVPSLRLRLEEDPSLRNRSRTALYEVSHNLEIPYRRDVFHAVQENFAPEPLRVRHLMWVSGRRMGGIAEECMHAVFGQSPIGVGENCYRHGELLLAGAIPVVQASLGVAALRYLPHLAVSNWHEVTPEMLRTSYQAIWDKVRAGYYSLEPLTNHFWHKHIDDIARGRPLDPFYAKFPNPPVTCPSWNCTGPL